jgi:hypothetical protein
LSYFLLPKWIGRTLVKCFLVDHLSTNEKYRLYVLLQLSNVISACSRWIVHLSLSMAKEAWRISFLTGPIQSDLFSQFLKVAVFLFLSDSNFTYKQLQELVSKLVSKLFLQLHWALKWPFLHYPNYHWSQLAHHYHPLVLHFFCYHSILVFSWTYLFVYILFDYLFSVQ